MDPDADFMERLGTGFLVIAFMVGLWLVGTTGAAFVSDAAPGAEDTTVYEAMLFTISDPVLFAKGVVVGVTGIVGFVSAVLAVLYLLGMVLVDVPYAARQLRNRGGDGDD